jgi:hypothetical protein
MYSGETRKPPAVELVVEAALAQGQTLRVGVASVGTTAVGKAAPAAAAALRVVRQLLTLPPPPPRPADASTTSVREPDVVGDCNVSR